MSTIPAWTGQAVAKMHTRQINGEELAAQMGVTPQYLSSVLNGKKKPKGIKERVMKAINELTGGD